MNNKNRLKAFIFLLLYILINRSQAGTGTTPYSSLNFKQASVKNAVNAGIGSALVLGTSLGIGALAIATTDKYNLINRYLKWQNADNLSSLRIDGELLSLNLAAGVAIPALSFWAIQKAYKSNPVSSWRKRFWNWYNKKPVQ